MWNNQQIQTLKEKATSFIADDYIRGHLSALNAHLNNYGRQLLIHKKNEKWREAECEANHLRARIDQILERAARSS
jgi:hypothetical protein